MERVKHERDIYSEAALDYCIKMIVTNQLNEQDLESESDYSSSSNGEGDSASKSDAELDHSKDKREDQKNIMKAWYNQFADQN